MTKTMIAVTLALGLQNIFAGEAQAEPVLFEASESPFMQTVHGCTQDDTLMEVRFSFDVHPHYARDHLNTAEKLDSAIGIIEDFTTQNLQAVWKDALSDVTFADIESGKVKPLQTLLTSLYEFTDESFNASDVESNGDNIIPVLRGGAYETQHELCIPS